MRRGRKPAPVPLKVLKGTRRDRMPDEDAPDPPPMRPECPEVLDSFGRAEWDRILPELDSLGVLARVDGAALMLYCSAYSQWVRAEVEVEFHGMLIETGSAGLKANPAVAMAHQARAQMISLLAEFGCTPASRPRLRVATGAARAGADRGDALGEFLKRRNG